MRSLRDSRGSVGFCGETRPALEEVLEGLKMVEEPLEPEGLLFALRKELMTSMLSSLGSMVVLQELQRADLFWNRVNSRLPQLEQYLSFIRVTLAKKGSTKHAACNGRVQPV